MVTKPRTSVLYEKGRQARHFILRIWTKTVSKPSSGSYENLTEDQDPSGAGPSHGGRREEVELAETWDRAVVGSDTIHTSNLTRRLDASGADLFGSTVSGFAALGLDTSHPGDTRSSQTAALASGGHIGSVPSPSRTSYYYDTMHSDSKEDKPCQNINNNSEDAVVSSEGDQVVQHVQSDWFEDKDWKLYYGGKKGKKKKLKKKVVLQVNTGERSVERECYVQLEEAPQAEADGTRRKRKKKRVRATKAKKKAKRAGVIAWKGMKLSWKYLKEGLILMTNGPASALTLSNYGRSQPRRNYYDYDRRKSRSSWGRPHGPSSYR